MDCPVALLNTLSYRDRSLKAVLDQMNSYVGFFWSVRSSFDEVSDSLRSPDCSSSELSDVASLAISELALSSPSESESVTMFDIR